MKISRKLNEGELVVLKFPKYGPPFKSTGCNVNVFEVNVQVVDFVAGDLYRVRPVSGHGCKVVSIEDLFFY